MAAKRQFWVRVTGGLCNRMRTLASAIGYAKETNRELRVCWPTTPFLQTYPLWQWRNWTKWGRFPAEHRFEAALRDLWDVQLNEVSWVEWTSFVNSSGSIESEFPPRLDCSDELLHLHTCHEFFAGLSKTPREYYEELVPQRVITSAVQKQISILGSSRPLFGIHVRSFAAHEATVAKSPLEWFVTRIEALHSQFPEARFYLVTDSAPVSEQLHRQFPGLLCEQDRCSGYNTRPAIQKALTDVYVLSTTDYILGSYFSSMSYMSATLQNGKGYEDTHYQWGSLPPR